MGDNFAAAEVSVVAVLTVALDEIAYPDPPLCCDGMIHPPEVHIGYTCGYLPLPSNPCWENIWVAILAILAARMAFSSRVTRSPVR